MLSTLLGMVTEHEFKITGSTTSHYFLSNYLSTLNFWNRTLFCFVENLNCYWCLFVLNEERILKDLWWNVGNVARNTLLVNEDNLKSEEEIFCVSKNPKYWHIMLTLLCAKCIFFKSSYKVTVLPQLYLFFHQ